MSLVAGTSSAAPAPLPAQAGTGRPVAATGSGHDDSLDWLPPVATARPATPQVAGATPTFTFRIDTASWTSAERATLASWTRPGSPQMSALLAVAGPPVHSQTLLISKAATGFAGEFYTGHIVLADLEMSVFLHEMNHAVHDDHVLSDSVWEEGLARAGEVAEMDRLASAGVPGASSYWDLHHSYSVDRYYDNDNVPDIGVQDGSIYGYGGPALPFSRYQQAGYAFGKLLVVSPTFLRSFNQRLFAEPDGALPSPTLVSMAAAVRKDMEGVDTTTWLAKQHVLDVSPPTGCRLYQRSSQYTVDFFCRSADGQETVQAGKVVLLDVFDNAGALLAHQESVTTALGWADMTPPAWSRNYTGRLRLVASADTDDGVVSSIVYISSGPEQGVFGVVMNASSGSVSFRSPTGQFATFTAPVVNGAFAAPTLEGVAGAVTISFTGEGKTVTRGVVKDSSPYSVVLRAS